MRDRRYARSKAHLIEVLPETQIARYFGDMGDSLVTRFVERCCNPVPRARRNRITAPGHGSWLNRRCCLRQASCSSRARTVTTHLWTRRSDTGCGDRPRWHRLSVPSVPRARGATASRNAATVHGATAVAACVRPAAAHARRRRLRTCGGGDPTRAATTRLIKDSLTPPPSAP